MHKLLIVDDEEINRGALMAGFFDLYEVLEAENGQQALDIIEKDSQIVAILLDLQMPVMNGLDVLRALNLNGKIQTLPVFIITASNDNAVLMEAYNLGAVDVIHKGYVIQFLRRRVANMIELYRQRKNLQEMVESKTQELIRQNNRLVEAMADVIEFHSNESGSHVKRVSGFTRIIMNGLLSEFPEYAYLHKDIESIAFASCLHDLGKIAVPDSILNKKGRLDDQEFETMKLHTVYGYEQMKQLQDIVDPKLYEYGLDIIRHHHERYDGRGYPDKISGENITIWSQAVALADVYDALTSERCYKKAFDHDTAVNMIMNGECGQFNPKIIKIFDKLKEELHSLRIALDK